MDKDKQQGFEEMGLAKIDAGRKPLTEANTRIAVVHYMKSGVGAGDAYADFPIAIEIELRKRG